MFAAPGIFFLIVRSLVAADGAGSPSDSTPPRERAAPAVDQVNLNKLTLQSSMFLGMQHGFRLLTEKGTREGLKGPFFGDWFSAVGALHGWSDGDPFLVNYIGHPMQGAVTGFIWIQNDKKRYRLAEFGRNPDYWKSRLRSALWSFAYSAQFEIGPLSEASIGNVQNTWPQQGFVDHVVTPTIGLGWTVGEDALDRFVIRSFEDRVSNPFARSMVRSWLNPSRSFANMLAGHYPWYRATRSGIGTYVARQKSNKIEAEPATAVRSLPLYEFQTTARITRFGSNDCMGGGASGALQVSPTWQLVVDVSGCTIYGLGENRSGDTLLYQIGPRWTPTAARRFSPYAQFLVGGMKVTQTIEDPAKKALWQQASDQRERELPPPKPDFQEFHESTDFAVTAGTGIDLKLSPAVAWRVASVDYVRSWSGPVNGMSYRNGFQFSSGLVFRMGTW